MGTIVTIWAAAALAVAVALAAAAPRIGRYRSAAWLVVLGLFLLALEEPALTFFLGLSGRQGDPDGIAGSVTPMARAHVIDAGVYSVAAAVLLGWVALTAFRRGQRWARRVLGWGWLVVTVTEVGTTLFVVSRGLPVPGAAGAAGRTGFGWQPLAVGLVAWAVGLWLARPESSVHAVPVGGVAAAPQ